MASANKRLKTGGAAFDQEAAAAVPGGASLANFNSGNALQNPSWSPLTLLGSKSYSDEIYTTLTDKAGKATAASRSPQTSESDSDETAPINGKTEALYRVTNRTEELKKRTAQLAFEHNNTSSESGPEESEFEQYLKKQRDRSVDTSNRKNEKATVIDLTLDDDDDVTVVSQTTSSAPHTSRQVQQGQQSIACYGCISPVDISAHRVPAVHPRVGIEHKDTWPRMFFRLFHGDINTGIIYCVDHEGQRFGQLKGTAAQALAVLLDRGLVKAEAILHTRHKGNYLGREVGQDVSATYQCSINLHGLTSRAIAVAQFLLQPRYGIRLQPRASLYESYSTERVPDYHLKVPKSRALPVGWDASGSNYFAALDSPQTSSYVDRTVEEVHMDIKNVFDSILSSDELPEMEPDPRVKTALLKHQKQGLWFMTQKEKDRVFGSKEEDNSSLWRLRSPSRGNHTFYHVITGEECRQQPPQVRGGILADMMGLGKTLSVLSLIVTSLDDARRAASNTRSNGRRVAKTTLLIAPLSTVQNWEEQIGSHIAPNTINCYVYHGASRELRVDKLADYDLIITTFNTVNNEFMRHDQRPSPLQQIHYYRIVLDEAHIIREAATKQFKAVHALSADRRWAVTGTPIQNKLEDLASLIRFMRLRPFDDKRTFTGYIGSGSKGLSPEQVVKLRLLVDSITLRRHKDRISLPKRTDKIVYLEFSSAEKSVYDAATAHTRGKVKDVLGQSKNGKLTGKSYIHILQTILRMRQICAHGRDLLSEEDQAAYVGLSSQDAIDLDELDENPKPAGLSPTEAYRALKLMQEAGEEKCSMCQRKTGPSALEDGGTSEHHSNANETVLGSLTPCMHLICNDCEDKFFALVAAANPTPPKSNFDNGSEVEESEWRVCPICTTYTRMKLFELTTEGYLEEEEKESSIKNAAFRTKMEERYKGPSTKVQALLKSLEDNRKQSTEDNPIKSVVFSSWTSHLDLIQFAFNRHGICYVRLDGSMNRRARQDAIATLRDDPKVEVILISIAAGGLGLNLTSACRVYVMEPQFNPAAEQQAIDRIHRLGQKREVACVRYIMKGSFEEKILCLQERKVEMAEQGLGRRGVSRQNIMELFRQI